MLQDECPRCWKKLIDKGYGRRVDGRLCKVSVCPECLSWVYQDLDLPASSSEIPNN